MILILCVETLLNNCQTDILQLIQLCKNFNQSQLLQNLTIINL